MYEIKCVDADIAKKCVDILLMGATQYDCTKAPTKTVCVASVSHISTGEWLEYMVKTIAGIHAWDLERHPNSYRSPGDQVVTGEVAISGHAIIMRWNRQVIDVVRRFYKEFVDPEYCPFVVPMQLSLTSNWVVFQMVGNKIRSFTPRFQEFFTMVPEFPTTSFLVEDGASCGRAPMNPVLNEMAVAVARKAYATMLDNSIDKRVNGGWAFAKDSKESQTKTVLMCTIEGGVLADAADLQEHIMDAILCDSSAVFHLQDYWNERLGRVVWFKRDSFEISIVLEKGDVASVYLKLVYRC